MILIYKDTSLQQSIMNMEDIIEGIEQLNVHAKNNDLVCYIQALNIDRQIKIQLLHLIDNDNYTDYMEIYNICMENDIELPPL